MVVLTNGVITSVSDVRSLEVGKNILEQIDETDGEDGVRHVNFSGTDRQDFTFTRTTDCVEPVYRVPGTPENVRTSGKISSYCIDWEENSGETLFFGGVVGTNEEWTQL